MGVIRRFAVWSMVFGVLAMAGGASALAFDGAGAGQDHRSAPVTTAPAGAESAVGASLVSDVPSDADAAAALRRWASSHTIPAE